MNEEQLNEAIQYNLDYLEGNYSIEEDLEETMQCLKKANKEIERLQAELDKTRLSELDKEYRINEAIEYIKANAMFDGKICCDDLYTSDCDKLIKILEGE